MKSYKITYENWDGQSVTDTYYFNLNETELSMLNAKYGGSLVHTLARLASGNDAKEMMDILMDVIKTAYGVMDDDRKHFRKAATNPAIWEDFVSTEGFNKFFLEVMGDDAKCSEFIRGIMPKAVREAVEKDTDGGTSGSKKLSELMKADVTIS